MASQSKIGLDESQVTDLRRAVGEGRRPRVTVAGPQFSGATTGTVVRVGDPAEDGADFVLVRVKVGGVTDELGFAPGELSLARRGRTTAATADPRTARSTTSTQAPRVRRSRTPEPEQPPAVETIAPAAKRRGRSAPRRTSPAPAVTITIASQGSSWSVSATRGARTAAKNVPVPPGALTAIAALLNLPEVEEAVAAVNGAALGAAEARAETLRAELAEIEAVLVSHQSPL